MSESADLWQKRLLNPGALGEKEKELWAEIEPILVELLEELKSNGKIEISYVQTEINHFKSILDNLKAIGTNNNLLLNCSAVNIITVDVTLSAYTGSAIAIVSCIGYS